MVSLLRDVTATSCAESARKRVGVGDGEFRVLSLKDRFLGFGSLGSRVFGFWGWVMTVIVANTFCASGL